MMFFCNCCFKNIVKRQVPAFNMTKLKETSQALEVTRQGTLNISGFEPSEEVERIETRHGG